MSSFASESRFGKDRTNETNRTSKGNPFCRQQSESYSSVPIYGKDYYDKLDDEVYKSPDAFPWSKAVKDLLRNTFRHCHFYPGQLQAINAVLANQDVNVTMPPGRGKSLCYQLPAVLDLTKDTPLKVTIVVTPYPTLAQAKCKALEVRCESLTNTEDSSPWRSICYEWQSGRIRRSLIFIDPKVLDRSEFQSALKTLNSDQLLSRIVVDCEHQHGYECYHWQDKVLNILKIPIIRLSSLRWSISRVRREPSTRFFKNAVARDDLKYSVKDVGDGSSGRTCTQLILNRFKDQYGFIYCDSVSESQDLVKVLSKAKVSAGTDLEGWVAGNFKVLCLVGNRGKYQSRPDACFALHINCPLSLPDYLQDCSYVNRVPSSEGFSKQDYECILLRTKSLKIDQAEFSSRCSQLQVLSYCQNDAECRRVICGDAKCDLGVFSSQKRCDTCSRTLGTGRLNIELTIASEVINLIKITDALGPLTFAELINVFIGDREAAEVSLTDVTTCSGFGSGRHLTRKLAERILLFALEHHKLNHSFEFGSLIIGVNAGPFAKSMPEQIRFIEDRLKTMGILVLKSDLSQASFYDRSSSKDLLLRSHYLNSFVFGENEGELPFKEATAVCKEHHAIVDARLNIIELTQQHPKQNFDEERVRTDLLDDSDIVSDTLCRHEGARRTKILYRERERSELIRLHGEEIRQREAILKEQRVDFTQCLEDQELYQRMAAIELFHLDLAQMFYLQTVMKLDIVSRETVFYGSTFSGHGKEGVRYTTTNTRSFVEMHEEAKRQYIHLVLQKNLTIEQDRVALEGRVRQLEAQLSNGGTSSHDVVPKQQRSATQKKHDATTVSSSDGEDQLSELGDLENMVGSCLAAEEEDQQDHQIDVEAPTLSLEREEEGFFRGGGGGGGRRKKYRRKR